MSVLEKLDLEVLGAKIEIYEKMVVIAQSFIKNGRNGDAYRYPRRFVPFKKFEKVRVYWT